MTALVRTERVGYLRVTSKALTEDMILADLTWIDEALDGDLTDEIVEGVTDRLRKLFHGLKRRVVHMSEPVLRMLGSVFQKVMAKLPGTSQNLIRREINRYAGHIEDAIEGTLSEEAVQEAVERALETAQASGLIPKAAEASRAEIAKAFAQHDHAIVGMIQANVEQAMDRAKKKVANIVITADKKATKGAAGKLHALKGYGVGMSASMVFGIIDNAGMLIGMNGVEDAVTAMGYSPQISAALGNTFSDGAGALLGGAVAFALWKILGVKGEGTTTQATIGVIVGCLIPIAVKMAIGALTGGPI